MSIHLSKKALQILTTAHELFMRYGFKRVTVEEVCKTAGVSKVTFYKYFSNKIGLVKEMLGRYYDGGIQDYQEIMTQNISFAEKMQQLILLKQKLSEHMSPEFLKELLLSEIPEIETFFLAQKKRTLDIFYADLQAAKDAGEIRNEISIEFIILMLEKIQTSAADPRFLEMFATPKEMVETFTSFFFYGILTPKETL